MIYFIQDAGTYHIKIGYTGGDPEGRLKALQTGNPSGLVLLLTIPGSEQEEQALHDRFRSFHVRGEWFMPSSDLLKFILEMSEREKEVTKSAPVCDQSNIRFYLAGKMTRTSSNHDSCWRDDIVDEDTIYSGHLEECVELPIRERCIYGTHSYTGPYYFDWGGGHTSFEDGGHGTDNTVSYHGDNHGGYVEDIAAARKRVFSLCLKAIKKSDVIFAWINGADSFGTFAEISYAKGLGKTVWIGTSSSFDGDMWFIFKMADKLSFAPTPREAFVSLFNNHVASLTR